VTTDAAIVMFLKHFACNILRVSSAATAAVHLAYTVIVSLLCTAGVLSVSLSVINLCTSNDDPYSRELVNIGELFETLKMNRSLLKKFNCFVIETSMI
jgi:hypothetical protein